mmetsp:Transcript_17189/g.39964  ORF Transcript_17189/g.39964 Transcript_17189/m.39964 type:complete len:234 (-) Transcript_17189:1375-2076(-)
MEHVTTWAELRVDVRLVAQRAFRRAGYLHALIARPHRRLLLRRRLAEGPHAVDPVRPVGREGRARLGVEEVAHRRALVVLPNVFLAQRALHLGREGEVRELLARLTHGDESSGGEGIVVSPLESATILLLGVLVARERGRLDGGGGGVGVLVLLLYGNARRRAGGVVAVKGQADGTVVLVALAFDAPLNLLVTGPLLVVEEDLEEGERIRLAHILAALHLRQIPHPVQIPLTR